MCESDSLAVSHGSVQRQRQFRVSIPTLTLFIMGKSYPLNSFVLLINKVYHVSY
jgi:hypothetical protein